MVEFLSCILKLYFAVCFHPRCFVRVFEIDTYKKQNEEHEDCSYFKFNHDHFPIFFSSILPMNAVFGKLVLDRIIAKLVEGRARDKQWRV